MVASKKGHNVAILGLTEKRRVRLLFLLMLHIKFKVLHKLVSKIQWALNFRKKGNTSGNV